MRYKKLDLALKRKIFHQLALLYFILVNCLERSAVVQLCTGAIFIGMAIEALRLRFPAINEGIKSIFGGIMRPHEKRKMSGLVWTLTGVFIVVSLFEDRKIINSALAYLIFGDTTAALVGTFFGKIKLGKKTLEGSISCFIVCFLISLLFLKDIRLALGGSLIATLIEFVRLPLSDNFWIPVMSSFVIYVLQI